MIQSLLSARTCDPPAASPSWHRLAWGALAILTVLVLATFKDYGITVDEWNVEIYGRMILSWYKTLGAGRAAFTFQDLFLYGGWHPALIAAAARLLPFSSFDTRHLLCGLTGVAGLWGTWHLARQLLLPRGAFLALIFCAASPEVFGNLFNNPVDLPFLTTMTWALSMTLYMLSREKIRLRDAAWAGVMTGLAMAIRVGGMMLFLSVAVGFAVRIQQRRSFTELGRCALAGIVMAAVAYGIMLAGWPWALEDPIHRPWQAFRHFGAMGMNMTFPFFGMEVRSTHLPWYYIPGFILIRAPELMLLLLAAAVAGVLFRRKTLAAPWAVALTALLFPPLYVILGRKVIYDGIRHLLFLWPLLSVVAAGALDMALTRCPAAFKKPAVTVLALYAVYHLGVMAAYHPYQSIYYNALTGGLAGANGRFETDVWSAAIKETVAELAKVIVSQEGPSALQKKYRVYACLPYRDIRPILPGNWIVEKKMDQADFVVVPSRHPCRTSGDQPLVARVERFGVTLAFAGDLRQRNRVSDDMAAGRVFCYHDIAPAPQDRWSRTPERLEEDFHLMALSGVTVISLDRYVESLQKGRPLPAKWAVLTFDDGTAGQFRHARPILKRFGYTATFYVPTQWVADQRGEFVRSAPAMSSEALRALIAEGHQVASHSHTHPRFDQLSADQVRDQIISSVSCLRTQSGIQSRDFCLPYGRYLPAHEKILVEAGMRSVALTSTDHGPGDARLIKVRRFEVLRDMTSAQVLAQISIGGTR